MHVGIVTPRYPPTIAGGGEHSVALLAEQLQHSSRVDTVVVLSFDGCEREMRNGVEVRRLSKVSSFITEWQNIRGVLALHNKLEQFDVVHSYNMELHPAIGALTSDSPIGSIATLNSYHFLPKSAVNLIPDLPNRLYEVIGYPTTGRILRHYMQQVDRFISLSTAVKKMYTKHNFDPEQIDVIGNMVDPSFSVPNQSSTDKFTLLYVGALKLIKGVKYLLQALKYLPDMYQLRIVGDGPEWERLNTTMQELELTDRVTFVGHVEYERIAEEYARADMFVHPCIWPEPFGRTIIEAMQASLPVVCTNIGGPVDLVRDPKLRCPPHDSKALASAVEYGRSKALEIGQKNKNFVYKEFSPSCIIPEITELYQRVKHNAT